MHQGGGLQGLAGPFPRHVAMGQAVQFLVNQGHQALESPVISRSPSLQQAGDFVGRGRNRFVRTDHTPQLVGKVSTARIRFLRQLIPGIAVSPAISRITGQMRLAGNGYVLDKIGNSHRV